MKKEEIKERIISRAVANLHEFGYPYATTDNIITDEVYRLFFKRMLEDTPRTSTVVDAIVDELLKEVTT